MRAILRAGRRFFVRDPLQLVLALAGVALGVAVVVGVDAASGSAARAFDRSVEAVGGRATHRLTGGVRGVAEEAYARLRLEHGVRQCAPVISATARVVTDGRRGATLHLLGVDPLAEAPLRPWLGFDAGRPGFDVGDLIATRGGVALSEDTAKELGVTAGDAFTVEVAGRRTPLVVVGELRSDDDTVRRGLARVALADVATVQEVTGRAGWLDHIDLRLDDENAIARVEAAVARTDADLVFEPDPRRSGVLDDLTAAFRLNLQALGLLALLVGAFLIHNTMQFSVVRRREQIGVLRAVGATRGQVAGAILIEAATLGALGSLLGLAVGALLAHALIEPVAATVRDFYVATAVAEVEVGASSLAKGLVLGVVASVLAAVAPALEATRVEPRHALQRTALESRVARGVVRAVPIGLGAIAIGLLLLTLDGPGIVLAYASIFAVLVGAACLVPAATLLILRVLHAPLGRVAGTVGRWAARGSQASLSRTSVATAALTVAIATGVGLGVMIGSFRDTVATWLSTALSADVYVSVPGPMSSRTEVAIDPDAVARLRATEGVADVATYRRVEVPLREGSLELAAVDPAPRSADAYTLLSGGEDDVRRVLSSDGGILVSEPLAFRLGLERGDELRFRTDRGWRRLEVAAVFRDYASERGYAVIGRGAFDASFDDPAVASMAIWADAGVAADELMPRLEAAVADIPQALSIRSERALREGSLEVFDRTFAVTDVLRTLCVVVAFLGVWSALTAMQLERRRESGVLRALGTTRRQVAGLVTLQNALLGLSAGVLAVPLGAVLAWLLADVVNRRSFGWTLLSVELPFAEALEAIVLAVVAAVLAGAVPAWRLSRAEPIHALRSE